MIDFLIYEVEEPFTATVLVLLGAISGSSDDRAGNEIAIYSCELFSSSCEPVDCNIKLFTSFESLHQSKEASREIVGVPYLTKKLYRLEINVRKHLKVF